ncbi:hypothetical protein LENED_001083 [Lentinula edodes]|uniref:Uncharacterized protein n=1 Tax=Lentinula edodes TaxID=5353 RepID=A0A1Q3DXG7_LENED|nr:hypothetical protein F5877DRAFT_77975 [Lentinula edodes]GAV99615.1 hypothetical protein LENED_001083 [Lentinula edodes]
MAITIPWFQRRPQPQLQPSSWKLVGFIEPSSPRALLQELCDAGTLTAALTGVVEENRYGVLTNACDPYPRPEDFMVVVHAPGDPHLPFETVPKLFIRHRGPIHNKYEQSAIDQEVVDNGFKPAEDAILFNRTSSAGLDVSMLIPAHYLVKSASKPTHRYGRNSLQFKVECKTSRDYKGPRMVNWAELFPATSFPEALKEGFKGIQDWYEDRY